MFSKNSKKVDFIDTGSSEVDAPHPAVAALEKNLEFFRPIQKDETINLGGLTARERMIYQAMTAVTNEKAKEAEEKTTVRSLTHRPVVCPVAVCREQIAVSDIMAHYLNDHCGGRGIYCLEMFNDKRSILLFDRTTMRCNDNVCLGVLVYGGETPDRKNLPADTGVCLPSYCLLNTDDQYRKHMPIIIMCSKTLLVAVSNEPPACEDGIQAVSSGTPEYVYNFWLVAPETTKNVLCTMSVYNRLLTWARSVVVDCRHFHQTQDANKFLAKDPNCITLYEPEIAMLSNENGEQKNILFLEIVIHGY